MTLFLVPSESFNAVIFTEVIEHLNPYYVSWCLSELNRILKLNGLLFLSTPNIASIGKRFKLLLGKNPLGPTHVREYTMNEIVKIITDHGFDIVLIKYSLAYDLTPYHAKGRDYLLNMLKASLRYPSKENLFKLLVVPLVKVIPSLRATIFTIAKKRGSIRPRVISRRY